MNNHARAITTMRPRDNAPGRQFRGARMVLNLKVAAPRNPTRSATGATITTENSPSVTYSPGQNNRLTQGFSARGSNREGHHAFVHHLSGALTPFRGASDIISCRDSPPRNPTRSAIFFRKPNILRRAYLFAWASEALQSRWNAPRRNPQRAKKRVPSTFAPPANLGVNMKTQTNEEPQAKPKTAAQQLSEQAAVELDTAEGNMPLAARELENWLLGRSHLIRELFGDAIYQRCYAAVAEQVRQDREIAIGKMPGPAPEPPPKVSGEKQQKGQAKRLQALLNANSIMGWRLYGGQRISEATGAQCVESGLKRKALAAESIRRAEFEISVGSAAGNALVSSVLSAEKVMKEAIKAGIAIQEI